MVLTVVYLMSIVNYVTCSFLCFLVNLTRVESYLVFFPSVVSCIPKILVITSVSTEKIILLFVLITSNTRPSVLPTAKYPQLSRASIAHHSEVTYVVSMA